MFSNCGTGEDSWESLEQHGDQTSQWQRKSTLNIHWKDWCWSSNTWAIWCKELTHWKRPWCWERLRSGGEGGDRAWDGWMASLTQWTWIHEQAPGDSERQGSLECRSPWGHKRSDMIERTTVISTVLYWHKRVDQPMKQNRVPRNRPTYSQWKSMGFPGDSVGKKSAWNAGDLGSIPGSETSYGRGYGNLLLNSCLEYPHRQRSLGSTVHGVAKSQTWTSDFHS